MSGTGPRWQDDTRSRSRSAGTAAAQDGAAGDRTARDAVPRAAGAAPSRGAQPPATGPAVRELVIDVTAEDIRLGVPGNVCLCPVARAAARALGDHAGILKVEADDDDAFYVGLYATSRNWEPYAAWFLPAEAAGFIRRFDGAAEVGPLTFTAARSTP